MRTFLGCAALLMGAAFSQEPATPDLLRAAVRDLSALQEDSGLWPYEGVYRVQGRIPAGYRVGGTALVAGTLLHAAPDDPAARKAFERGLAAVLEGLADPLLDAGLADAYDVRVWGQTCALDFLCRVRAAKAAGAHEKDVGTWIPRLVKGLVAEEIPGGGWNYATRRQPASFVTAPVVQALLWAKSQGEDVPRELLDRARAMLEAARAKSGAFLYSGVFKEGETRFTRDQVEGSIARSALCEATLLLLGGGSVEALQGALDAFHKHWDELEKRRKKTGTHEGPYSIAPYYFYFGHRYAAQAIRLLPEASRAKERERLLALLLRTRDADGTWNDRVFPRSRAYGTAMVALALLGDRDPLPPALGR